MWTKKCGSLKTWTQKCGWYKYGYEFMWTLFFYNVNKILWMIFHLLITKVF